MLGSIKSLFHRTWIEKHALKDVSLEVSEGELVGIIGANGAGKTTLVKILAGIIHPSSGKARVLGYNPWERDNAFRRQISLIMGQKAQLWWDLPAEDCFILLREIYQIPEKDFQERLNYLSEHLEVKSLLNIQIRRLSLGERMKMELIAALLHNPKVVYLDEPTIGLDLTAQRKIREFLLEYRRQHQPAMLITSHYMEDIERLCERIIIVREGSIVYDGSLVKILNRYAQNKIISLTLKPGFKTDELSQFGEVLSSSDTNARIQISRTQATEAASAILSKLPVSDLSIEEEDIGTVIERIMKTHD